MGSDVTRRNTASYRIGPSWFVCMGTQLLTLCVRHTRRSLRTAAEVKCHQATGRHIVFTSRV